MKALEPTFRLMSGIKVEHYTKYPKVLSLLGRRGQVLPSKNWGDIKKTLHNEIEKMEKATLGFRIYKIWQILKCFPRSFHQA